MNFAESTVTIGDVPVLQLSGEIEVRSREAFHEALTELLLIESALVVLDLGGVTFFDSTGLHVLDTFDQQAQRQGTRIALAGLQPRVLRLFEITGLDSRFSIFASADLAASAN